MNRVPGKHLRARKKVQERVRCIVIVNIDQLRFHNEFEALNMRQPTKLQGKYINCEKVWVMNKTRMSKKDNVVMVKWPYLAIVSSCSVCGL
jgi:hypothetical protein